MEYLVKVKVKMRSKERLSDMKTKMRPFVSLFLVVGMIGVVAPASASVYAASPLGILKNCAYYSESGHCVDWYPNEWTCYNDLESSS